MDSIEKTGATVEAAIQAGLAELGVEPYQVMVEVLEDADQGIMGHGARPARVRLVLMGGQMPQPIAPPTTEQEPEAEGEGETQQRGRGRRHPARHSNQRTSQRDTSYDAGYADDDDADEIGAVPPPGEVPDDEADDEARVGKEVLTELLGHMDVEGVVTIHHAQPDLEAKSKKGDDEAQWVLNISGKRINRLIGRRGETLASLQYIVRLIVSRRLQIRSNLVVDAAQYKSRRSDRLQQLARRMADQAITQRRTVTLEPMPAHERRIIHLTLRERKDIVTKSIGDGDTRKVTIAPAE